MHDADHDLIQRMLRGDENAFTAFFDLYASKLASYAARRSSFPDATIEDIVQTTRRPLSLEALARVRANVFAEFQRQTADTARRSAHRWFLAAAAAVSAVTVGVFLIGNPSGGTPVAQLVSGSGEAVLSDARLQRSHPVETGAMLHASERWTAQEPVLARLTSGGSLRLDHGAVVVAEDAQTLELQKGRVYFDFPHGAGRFVLHTALGSIEHVGTQFEVAQLDGRVRVRVREGGVLLHAENESVSVESGMEALMDHEGRIDRSSYPTYGDDWEWVESIAPPFDIENRPLADFLSWVSRETGRQVTFIDARAREVASHTTLHGSVHGLRPMDALYQVLSTTSLRFEVKGSEIRIASRE